MGGFEPCSAGWMRRVTTTGLGSACWLASGSGLLDTTQGHGYLLHTCTGKTVTAPANGGASSGAEELRRAHEIARGAPAWKTGVGARVQAKLLRGCECACGSSSTSSCSSRVWRRQGWARLLLLAFERTRAGWGMRRLHLGGNRSAGTHGRQQNYRPRRNTGSTAKTWIDRVSQGPICHGKKKER